MANSGLYNQIQGNAANAIAGYFGGAKTPPTAASAPSSAPNMDAWKSKARDALANAFGPAASPSPAPASTPPATGNQ